MGGVTLAKEAAGWTVPRCMPCGPEPAQAGTGYCPHGAQAEASLEEASYCSGGP